MKFNIENQLFELDKFIQSKPKKDVLYIQIAAGLLPLVFSYLLFFSMAEHYKVKAVSAHKSIDAKLKADNAYLLQHPESEISLIDNQIKNISLEYDEYKQNNEYVKFQLEKISALYYDEQTWGEFIDSISENAKQNHIRIVNYTNEFSDDKNSFGHVLDISLETEGSYKRTMRFINALEKSFLVVDIHTFKMESGKKINATIKLSVWGITY